MKESARTRLLFELRPRVHKQTMWKSRGREFQGEGTVSAKTLKQEQVSLLAEKIADNCSWSVV